MHLLRFVRLLLVLAAGSLVTSLPAQDARLINLASRADVGTGGNILFCGFTIAPGANKTVLIRAVGPTLSGFGVSGALADPRLELYSNNTLIQSNDNWAAADGATFASVGAFSLPAGSKDAALVATLAPGGYTAQVSGVGGGVGVALVEVYEVGSTGPRMTNLSTRAVVGTGDHVLIPGVVINPGSGTRRLLVRAVGPTLAGFGVTGTLADPTLVVKDAAGATLASNDNWGVPIGSAASGAALALVSGQAGAFALPADSKDAAVLVDLAPGSYTVQVSGVNATTGVSLVELYDVTPAGTTTVSIASTQASTDESGQSVGNVTFTRTGDTSTALLINYSVGGTATNGIDYQGLGGTVTLPSGATSVVVEVRPYVDTSVESTETVTLTLLAGTGYAVGSSTGATVSIADTPGTLFVSTLRPATGAAGSVASGLASIVLSADGSLATVNVSFSNLGSGQVGSHLFLGDSTSEGDYVLNLPLGQVTGYQWNIYATATATAAQIVDAIKSGRIYVGIDTSLHPAGELRGAFLTAAGSQTFVAPAAPPAINTSSLTAADAARLLLQGTFGPKRSEIDALVNTSVDAWITAQIAVPATDFRAAELDEFNYQKSINPDLQPNDNFQPFKQRAWFRSIPFAPDQLRQRMAFALSQIFVIGDDGLNSGQTEGAAYYWDILAKNAFGNFRTLLEQVSLNPIMGSYLSSLKNAKADPVAGTNPDENFAREIMQLFTVGLIQLQPDGTLKLDAAGLPIATYNQITITETAKVFTGWSYFSTLPNPNFRRAPINHIDPMMLYPAFHEPGQKTIINNLVIPANLGGTEDLKRTLDALFNHDNTPPFICRQLIQRLVTDNPSPGYVYRVAQKFVNNGSGVRGDLAAVVRAILTDYEARSLTAAAAPGFGKLREPLLRYTALLRSFGATTLNGRNNLVNAYDNLYQAPQKSPSVFNFFEPGYVQPGTLAAAGLVAPEFQITDDTTAILVPNFLGGLIFATSNPNSVAGQSTFTLNLTAEQALVGTPTALLDHLSLVMTGGQLTPATRSRVTTSLSTLSAAATPLERAQTAILLIATSPDG
ncbi:MAG: DUF1800 family protein, partial [Opitutaceae bacterium]|nr:DUF1800 family protein [Opitutaceae bacterium]